VHRLESFRSLEARRVPLEGVPCPRMLLATASGTQGCWSHESECPRQHPRRMFPSPDHGCCAYRHTSRCKPNGCKQQNIYLTINNWQDTGQHHLMLYRNLSELHETQGLLFWEDTSQLHYIFIRNEICNSCTIKLSKEWQQRLFSHSATQNGTMKLNSNVADDKHPLSPVQLSPDQRHPCHEQQQNPSQSDDVQVW